MEDIIYIIDMFFFYYMFAYAIIFFLTTFAAALSIDDLQVRRDNLSYLKLTNRKNYIPVSILVPAYNEEVTIIDTVESLMNLDYPEYEIIIINDGSKDDTSDVVIKNYELRRVARPFLMSTPCKDPVSFYEGGSAGAAGGPKIILVNKVNGGKSDALNMGINISSYPLFVCMDADSLLQSDALLKISEAFLNNRDTIAAGGNIKVANSVALEKGRVAEIRAPKKPLVIFQTLEYFRTFLASRVALNIVNANLILSGAFAMYSKKAAVNVGGYSVGVIGEDMEIIVKMHAFYRKNKIPYHISYVADAVCWTQVPETLAVLRSQRRRWHIGMWQSLRRHMYMLLNRRYGFVGMLAFPYYLLMEYFTPLIEVAGLLTIGASYVLGLLNVQVFVIYLAIYVGYGILVSIISIFMEKHMFSWSMNRRVMLKLMLFAVLESLGFRQTLSLIRLGAFFNTRNKRWGDMIRTKHAKTDANIAE